MEKEISDFNVRGDGVMSLESTPRSNQLHIGIFGRRNSGKSSLINAITNQNISLVSDVLGTTTDPVYKTMEIYGIGPCVFIDTAGIDDEGDLGYMRVEKTKAAIDKTDIAIVVCVSDDISEEMQWIDILKLKNTPFIIVVNKADLLGNVTFIEDKIKNTLGVAPVVVSAINRTGIEDVIDRIIEDMPKDFEKTSIVGDLVKEDDTVLLVMPQDIQAPKGRLILPQVQVIRDLLDKKCIVTSVTTDKLDVALKSMVNPPKLIITDSQVFDVVYAKKPVDSLLTSFSVLFAAYKGDIDYYIEGALTIDKLNEGSRVLIAEACTHAPLTEDIGREKIPAMLRKLAGEGIKIDIVSGADFPKDLTKYDLVIQCGACMFNRKYVMSRIDLAKEQKVAMTNYGIVIAKVKGILDKVSIL